MNNPKKPLNKESPMHDVIVGILGGAGVALGLESTTSSRIFIKIRNTAIGAIVGGVAGFIVNTIHNRIDKNNTARIERDRATKATSSSMPR